MPNGDVAEEAQAPRGPGRGLGRGREPTLEERVSIFDSIGSSIDDLVGTVKAIPSLIKEAAYYTYYTAKAALGLAAGLLIAGTPQALIFPVGMVGGAVLGDWKNKEKTTFKKIANELAIGGILGGFVHYIFLGSRYLIKVAKTAYGTVAGFLTGAGCAVANIFPFLTAHEYLNRALISDYKPQPLSDMGKQIKKMWPIIPPLIANFTVVPEYLGHTYQMPVAAGISLAYGLLKGDKKEEENKEANTIKSSQAAQPYQEAIRPAT